MVRLLLLGNRTDNVSTSVLRGSKLLVDSEGSTDRGIWHLRFWRECSDERALEHFSAALLRSHSSRWHHSSQSRDIGVGLACSSWPPSTVLCSPPSVGLTRWRYCWPPRGRLAFRKS